MEFFFVTILYFACPIIGHLLWICINKIADLNRYANIILF
jgi:hypothetical protein